MSKSQQLSSRTAAGGDTRVVEAESRAAEEGGGLLSIGEAGERLGVSESTVWRRIRRGELPSVLTGGRRKIPAAALARPPQERHEGSVPPFVPDHPLFRLAGAGKSGGHGPGARDKHAILDE